MPEQLKVLVIIIGLAVTVFSIVKTPACSHAISPDAFQRRRNLWFAITLIVFLAHNFWIYIFFTALLLVNSLLKESNKVALIFFVLFAAPPFSVTISGVAGIGTLFPIDYLRILALTVLLPEFLSLSKQPDTVRFGRLLPDKILAGYIFFFFLLTLNASSFTHALRGAFLSSIDIFFPYYVASRSLKTVRDFRDALMAFSIAALILSAIAVFEFSRHWLLYSPLEKALGINWGYGNYMGRGEGLRATGSVGHPIVLGYVLAVGLGFFTYLRKSVPNLKTWILGLLLIAVGLYTTQSRGPWIGTVAIFAVFLLTGRAATSNLMKLGAIALLLSPLLLLTSLGDYLMDRLPFIGTYTDESIIYRQRLMDVSIALILENPIVGVSNFMLSPAMQELKQGEGIIDIVNTYIGVGLTSGVVGLSLFSFFFITVAFGIFKTFRNCAEKDGEFHLLGRTLLAVLIGILITIGTVSSISVIAIVYWLVAGLGVGYASMAPNPNRAEMEISRATESSKQYRRGK